MADGNQLAQYLESYVDSGDTQNQQAESLEAIATMLKKDVLTMEQLVLGMDKYLTSKDHILRARGMLLLAESLARIERKPLDSAVIHSLATFFSDRLEDWKALHGALVGCLTLLKRKANSGMVSTSDAKMIAQSFMQNMQVQSLAKHDRELCYQLLDCLLIEHPDAAEEMGEELVYGICEAGDGEKDPKCLSLVFHIVEVLGKMFSDSSSPLETYAEDLFEILGCYFPIHFTHSKGEDTEVKRDDLSRHLMLAMSSTPLFEPYAVPLFLEKLSSSLLSAKVDSLTYLSDCVLSYGSDRMKKHMKSIWSAIKETILTSSLEPTLSLTSDLINKDDSQEKELVKKAILLLRKVVMQNDVLLSNVVISDADIGMIIDSTVNFGNQSNLSPESIQKLHAVGCILYVSAKASSLSCSKLFNAYFLRLINATCLCNNTLSRVCSPDETFSLPQTLNIGAIYLCVELLAACRDLEMNTSEHPSAWETVSGVLINYASCLIEGFSSTLLSNLDRGTPDSVIYMGVKCLGLLATLPEDLSSVSKSLFEQILETFMTVFATESKNTLAWGHATRELVLVGSYIYKFQRFERIPSFMLIVLDRIISSLSMDDCTVPSHIKLDTICDIGATGLEFMQRIAQGFEDVISASFSDMKANGNVRPEILSKIMLAYTSKVIPCLSEAGGSDDTAYRFAISIWNHVQNSKYLSLSGDVVNKELLNAIMLAMKVAVAYCSEERQSRILEKADNLISSSATFPLTAQGAISISSQVKDEHLAEDVKKRSCIHEWPKSLFASVIMALRPQTLIPNEGAVMMFFVTALLEGHIPSAQALGSMLNKLRMKTDEELLLVDYCLKELVSSLAINSLSNGLTCRSSAANEYSKGGLLNLKLIPVEPTEVSSHAICGLAWIAKGLLMRGHETADYIVTIFLSLLAPREKLEASQLEQGLPDGGNNQKFLIFLESTADAFDVIMSDSQTCLNTKFHAVIRPLYKQRLLSTMIPVFLSTIQRCDSSISRDMLYLALAHIISNAPLGASLSDSRRLTPILLECLSVLSKGASSHETIYRLLLVLSAVLTDESGKEVVLENARRIIDHLIELVSYPHMMVIRETAVQCLIALSVLPHTRMYPMKNEVLRALSKALDDPKRRVRQEAVRCRGAWLDQSLG